MDDIFARMTAALRGRLAALDRKLWPLIAAEVGVSAQLPDKVVYQPARQFKPKTIAPLIQFFEDVDAGRRALPVSAEASNRPRGNLSEQPAPDASAVVSDERDPDRPCAIAFGNRRRADRGRQARAK